MIRRENRKIIVKICTMLFIITVYFVSVKGTPVWASSCNIPDSPSRTVTVGFTDIPGLSTVDADGNRTGLIIDYLNEIAKYTNWDYKYIDSTAETIVEDMQDNKFELMGGTYYSPEYEQFFTYPKYSMGNTRSILFCRKDNQDIKSYDLRSLNGKTIGVYGQAKDSIEKLKNFLLMNELDCTLKTYTLEEAGDSENLYHYLEKGEVDMLLGNEFEASDDFRVVADFAARPVYIVARAGNQELVKELNMALEKILESDPGFYEKKYQENYPSPNMTKLSLSQDELDYIASKKTVTVAVVKDSHPFYCVDNPADLHEGVLPDLLKALTDFSGLSFEYVFADTYGEAVELVKTRQVDLLGYYMDSEASALQCGLALTKPYISLNNIIVKNKSCDFPSEGLTMGILEGRPAPGGIKAGQALYYKTIHECLAAANKGEVDFVYGLSTSIEQEMQAHRYANLVPLTSINNRLSVSLAMDRPIHPDLMTVINKGIESMSEDEQKTLLDRNMISMGYSSLTLRKLIDANPLAFTAIFCIFVLIVAASVVILMRARVKNSLIQSELERSEAKSRAKGEFLSKMSHEIRTPMNAIVGLSNLVCMEKDLPKAVEDNLKKIKSSSAYLLSLINDILDMSRIENGKMEMNSEEFSLNTLLGELEPMIHVQADEKGVRFVTEFELTHTGIKGDPVRLRQVVVNLLSNAVKFTPKGGEIRLLVTELRSSEVTAEFLFSVRDNGVGIPPEDIERIFMSFEQLGTSSAKSAGTGLGLPISYNIVRAMGGTLKVDSAPGKGSNFHFTLQFELTHKEEEGSASQAGTEHNDLNGVRILLAEDNDLNAEIAMELLTMHGAQVERAVNGREATDMFSQAPAGAYHVILMDIRMPVMDGLEAARAIRDAGRPDSGTIPIIAMTANSFREDYNETMEAGMNGFIPKPVDLEYLFRVLRENLAKNI